MASVSLGPNIPHPQVECVGCGYVELTDGQVNGWPFPSGSLSSPQSEVSGVLDRVTHLKGELPTRATPYLRNVSGEHGAGTGGSLSGLEVS